MEVWCYPTGTWSTWHCKHSRPMLPPSSPGSLFICGHRNVNSLSLSIREMTTVAPTLPHEEVWRSASHNSQALSPRLGPRLGRPNRRFTCSRHGVVRRRIVVGCVMAAACRRGTNIQPLEEEMPPKDPLSFMQPRTSTACFIFKAYPVTKDTSVLHLDYMWTSVSSCMGGRLTCLWAAPRHHYVLHAF